MKLSRRDLLGAGVALAAAGLAGPALALSSGPARFDWTLHPPEDAGLSRAGLKGIRAAIERHLDSHEQAGAVTAIARYNKLVWYEAQGVRDPTTGTPMRKDDIFRMMSSSKPVTAICVLMMMEAGKLALEDPVSRFIPTFKNPQVVIPPPGWEKALQDPSLRQKLGAEARLVPAEREITIKDLLTHVSGLNTTGSIAGTPMGNGPGILVNDLSFSPSLTLAEFIPRLGQAALDFNPGTRFSYSPLAGFDTLLRVVEIASGLPADVFMRERLFEPLDMRDTGFNVPESKQDRVLKLWERKDNSWHQAQPLFSGAQTRYFSGAGGLFSTVHDYMQLEAMLFNRGELNGRRILKPETVALMSTNQVGDMFSKWFPPVTSGLGFGLGVGITLDPASADWGRGKGAFGWGGAYGTESWVDPEHELTVAFFVQQPVRPALVDFQKAVLAAIIA
jgi:CubicO group peptidase (beta-lactamase class C family)